MDTEIAQLAQCECRCADMELEHGGSRVQRMVHVIRHVHSKEPVIGAILEQITQRHRRMAETVDK